MTYFLDTLDDLGAVGQEIAGAGEVLRCTHCFQSLAKE